MNILRSSPMEGEHISTISRAFEQRVTPKIQLKFSQNSLG